MPSGKLQFVDTCYRIKKINENLLAYTSKDILGQQSNDVKYLKIGFSEFSTQKVVDEFGGKLTSFHVTSD